MILNDFEVKQSGRLLSVLTNVCFDNVYTTPAGLGDGSGPNQTRAWTKKINTFGMTVSVTSLLGSDGS